MDASIVPVFVALIPSIGEDASNSNYVSLFRAVNDTNFDEIAVTLLQVEQIIGRLNTQMVRNYVKSSTDYKLSTLRDTIQNCYTKLAGLGLSCRTVSYWCYPISRLDRCSLNSDLLSAVSWFGLITLTSPLVIMLSSSTIAITYDSIVSRTIRDVVLPALIVGNTVDKSILWLYYIKLCSIFDVNELYLLLDGILLESNPTHAECLYSTLLEVGITNTGCKLSLDDFATKTIIAWSLLEHHGEKGSQRRAILLNSLKSLASSMKNLKSRLSIIMEHIGKGFTIEDKKRLIDMLRVL